MSLEFCFPFAKLCLGYLRFSLYPVLYRPANGQVALGGDAHHQVGLESHQDVLEGVPEVGEEEDEELVVEVEVEPLDVDDDRQDEEGVHDGQGDQSVVEG